MNIYHDPKGLVFRKFTADSGISYLSVPLEDVDLDDTTLLVRHGKAETGRCGYYPLKALYQSQEERQHLASTLGKRPPSEDWINRIRHVLETQGLSIHQ